jgi:hypothetical protein
MNYRVYKSREEDLFPHSQQLLKIQSAFTIFPNISSAHEDEDCGMDSRGDILILFGGSQLSTHPFSVFFPILVSSFLLPLNLHAISHSHKRQRLSACHAAASGKISAFSPPAEAIPPLKAPPCPCP